MRPCLTGTQIATVQTVAGTGACRIGAVFLNKHWPFTNENGLAGPFRNQTSVYLGVPTWPNYDPLFRHAGFLDVKTYDYLDSHYEINLSSILKTLESAEERSIFVFQGCCHNPTGRDYSQDEWKRIAQIMAGKRHFAFFDTAYQGLGASEDSDAWAVRWFAEKSIDMLVAQSFSKNHGLYSERVGALHVMCADDKIAANVVDQLRALTRWEVSSAPAFGAELVNIVLGDSELETGWKAELHAARDRLQILRRRLHDLLMDLATPVPQGRSRGWNHLVEETGLFSYTSLLPEQIDTLASEHHIYMPGNGRINISGLNERNVERVARAFDAVIRQSGK